MSGIVTYIGGVMSKKEDKKEPKRYTDLSRLAKELKEKAKQEQEQESKS